MQNKDRLRFTIAFLIFTLCLSLANVGVAKADEGTPTEPPVTDPTDVPTELPPTPEDTIDVPSTDPATVEELLAEAPENTNLVVLDENGDAVSLAAQEAVDIVQGADPTWCPTGETPGSAGCRAFTSLPTSNQNMSALINDMRTNPGSYSSGTIYLEDPSGVGFTTPLILDDSAGSLSTSFDTLKTISLTIIGGWVPSNNTFNGDTEFGLNGANQGYISIGNASNPWVGNISLQDITVNNNATSNPSVGVYTTTGTVTLNDVDVNDSQNAAGVHVETTTGDISLYEVDIQDGINNNGISLFTNSGDIYFDNVDVQGQDTGYTALLQAASGDITITNGSTFDGNNNNLGFSATSASGSILVTGTSGNRITFTSAQGAGDAVNNNGATLSAPTITLTYISATNNDGNGIAISNADLVTLNNVTATGNGTDIGSSGNADNNNVGSGVYVSGNPGSTVIINGGIFRRNQRYGIEVINGTIYILASPSCGTGINVNDSGCYNAATISDSTPPTISFISRTAANVNGWNNTDVVLTWSCADPESGVFNSTVSQTISGEGINQSAIGTCTNHVGLTASDTQTGINIDKTAPSASASASPAPNGNGWNNANVTVSFSGSDALSGLDFCDADMLVSTEGSGQSASGTCTDNAGNVSMPAIATNINIDKSTPTLSLPSAISVGTALPAGAIVNYIAGVTDNLDGSVTVDCLPLSGATFPLGTTLVTCSSTDQAGNSASGSFNLTVSDTTVITTTTGGGTATETEEGPDVFIPVTGGMIIEINCVAPVPFNAQSANAQFTFNNLCGYQAFLENLDESTLPGNLPAGSSFLGGFTMNVMRNGEVVQPLPSGAEIVIEFELPTGSQTGEFAVFSWNGSEWIEVTGEQTSSGFFNVTTTEGGTFIFVQK